MSAPLDNDLPAAAAATAASATPTSAAFAWVHACQDGCGSRACTSSAGAVVNTALTTPAATATTAHRLWSESHHWRETDANAAAKRIRRAISHRKAVLLWVMGEAPEGSCEKCLQLPRCVVELACGHQLCDNCMREHVANRATGRLCPHCHQKTIRPEGAWIRWPIPPTAEQREERAAEWNNTNRNPIVIIYDYQAPDGVSVSLPAASAAVVSPTAALPAKSAATVALTAALPPPTTEPPSPASEIDMYRLALDQMKAKLLKQGAVHGRDANASPRATCGGADPPSA